MDNWPYLWHTAEQVHSMKLNWQAKQCGIFGSSTSATGITGLELSEKNLWSLEPWAKSWINYSSAQEPAMGWDGAAWLSLLGFSQFLPLEPSTSFYTSTITSQTHKTLPVWNSLKVPPVVKCTCDNLWLTIFMETEMCLYLHEGGSWAMPEDSTWQVSQSILETVVTLSIKRQGKITQTLIFPNRHGYKEQTVRGSFCTFMFNVQSMTEIPSIQQTWEGLAISKKQNETSNED